MFDMIWSGQLLSRRHLNRRWTEMRKLDVLATVLVLVGGLNWGLVAVARFDLVAWIFGGMDFGQTSIASRIVYGLVGLAAVYGVASLLGARRTHGRLATATH
jgi:uncharacterized membrane protein YuzA (DUF378 family)